MCLGVKHILTNEAKCKGWNPMTPKCILTLGVAFVRESQIFRTLVGKANKHQIDLQDTIRKFLKRTCLKCLALFIQT